MYKNKKIRRVFDSLVFALLFLVSLTDTQILSALASDSGDGTSYPTTFVVTAYYSPLPNQSFYIRGNYDADRRLNGDGVRGASGKVVYPGMLAAPRSYAFGTRIALSGLGLGIVDDRGGAIVSSGGVSTACDRIDVWMGYGEEGLRRALAFGRRRVAGRILTTDERSDAYTPLTFDGIAQSSVDAQSYMSQFDATVTERRHDLVYTSADSATSFASTIFRYGLAHGSRTDNVKNLERVLAELSYYYGPTDGVERQEFTDAIILLQIDEHIISRPSEAVAGFYGPTTRTHLAAAYERFRREVASRRVALSGTVAASEQEGLSRESRKTVIETTERETQIRALKARVARAQEIQDMVDSFGSPRLGEQGAHVRRLQKALASLGYFPYRDTAIFGAKTRDALQKYQSDRGLLASADAAKQSAGVLTDATRLSIKKDLLALGSPKDTEVAMR